MAEIINFNDWKDPDVKALNDLLHEIIIGNRNGLIAELDSSINIYEFRQRLDLFSQQIMGLLIKQQGFPPEDLIESLVSGTFYQFTSYIKDRVIETPFVRNRVNEKFQ